MCVCIKSFCVCVDEAGSNFLRFSQIFSFSSICVLILRYLVVPFARIVAIFVIIYHSLYLLHQHTKIKVNIKLTSARNLKRAGRYKRLRTIFLLSNNSNNERRKKNNKNKPQRRNKEWNGMQTKRTKMLLYLICVAFTYERL